MSDSPVNWPRFAELLKTSNRIVLASHQRPDGDSLGSTLAMTRILQKLGKEVRVANPHPVPPNLACLDPDGQALRALDQWTGDDRAWMETADLFLILDTSSWAQMAAVGPLFQNFQGKRAILDHHVKSDEIDAERFVDEHAAATGILVERVAQELGVALDKTIAEPLFVAIATDTGWFRFDSVKAETYRTIARLIEVGVVPSEIYKKLFEQESLGRLRLTGRTLAKTENHCDGQLMFTFVMQDDLHAAGAVQSDTEDIVNMTLQVKGSQLAIFMSELVDKTFKISFRSRCDVDCSVLAKMFGGGGHRAAAGAASSWPFAETRAALLQAASEALKNLRNDQSCREFY